MTSQPLGDTTSTIKRIIRGCSVSAPFSHPEGPTAAASTMARHLRGIFAGDSLRPDRPNAPPTLPVPHCLDACPFDKSDVDYYLRKRLARRRAPGGDHIRAEMLLPIRQTLVPVLCMLFQLCWRWSRTPASWRLAQVVPIYKKGDPLDPGTHPAKICRFREFPTVLTVLPVGFLEKPTKPVEFIGNSLKTVMGIFFFFLVVGFYENPISLTVLNYILTVFFTCKKVNK